MIAYTLREWVDESKLNIHRLCENPRAIDWLSANTHRFEDTDNYYHEWYNDCWFILASKPWAIDLLDQHLDKVLTPKYFPELCNNSAALHIIQNNLNLMTQECWNRLSAHEWAIDFIRANLDKFKLKRSWICKNLAAGDIVRANIHLFELNDLYDIPELADLVELKLEEVLTQRGYDKIFRSDWDITWQWMVTKPYLIHIIKKHLHRFENNEIDWSYLCRNPAAIDIIQNNLHRAGTWESLVTNPAATHIIEANVDILPDRVWMIMAQYEHFKHIIKANLNKLDIPIDMGERDIDGWEVCLSQPWAVDMINLYTGNSANINWDTLATNSGAIELLETNLEELGYDYETLSENPAIFTYDYSRMKQQTTALTREIVAAANHPNRLMKWLEAGGEIDSFLN